MLDGSAIRQAREAKGMTQAELAAAVGIAQQTIGKIETGIVERTGYEREIAEALGLAPGPVSPLQVLRTILCANPTAEQVLAALDANGLKIMPRGAGPTVERDAIDDPIGYIKDVLARHNLTPGGLALKVKISGSTLTRAMNDPDYKFVLSTRTLQKIKEWDNAQ
jgi:transcriptional regulator with XRE-family HTH domain